MKISFLSHSQLTEEYCLVLGAFENDLDSISSKILSNTDFIKKAAKKSAFKGEKGEVLSLYPAEDLECNRILVIGLGKPQEITLRSVQEIGAKIISTLQKTNLQKIIIDIEDNRLQKIDNFAASIVSGIHLRNWKFDIYKTQKKELSLKEVLCVTSNPESSEKAFQHFSAVNEGVFLTRHTVSEPPNVLYPESMSALALELRTLGIKVEVLGKQEMSTLKMGALLGVSQGSIHEPQLIILQWLNGSADQKPIAFVGKGVTFDSGGISIKPSNGMEDMKYDMAGSAAVLGTLKALALRNAKVNVIGVMGMVENMPSGSAQRPADVVESMSGQTVEVVNTDAEGRLVLADALWYTQNRFHPKLMIDLATLTGAIGVALGKEYAGLFSNDDSLAQKLFDAGQVVGEQLWRLPMGESYDREIDSEIADVKNVGSGKGGGSITAAQFLKRFVNNVLWAHLDIANVAWQKQDHPLTGKGATGFGVRLLNEFIKRNYEN